MRCPTCGAPVMVRKDSWECGYCCDCGNLPRPRIVLTVDVEEEPKLTIESLAENADPDTALLLRKFSKTLGAWDVEELSAMGAVEILERAYGEDHREGIAMWSALLYAAGSRLKAPREARWLLHSCCPYGTDGPFLRSLGRIAAGRKAVAPCLSERLCGRGAVPFDRCRSGAWKTGAHGAVHGAAGRESPPAEKVGNSLSGF